MTSASHTINSNNAISASFATSASRAISAECSDKVENFNIDQPDPQRYYYGAFANTGSTCHNIGTLDEYGMYYNAVLNRNQSPVPIAAAAGNGTLPAFLAVSASFDCTLKVWDLTSCSELKTLRGHSDDVLAVAIPSDSFANAPDGLKVISASSDKTLKLWDLASGTELLTFTGHTDYVTAVAITPDGKRVISGSVDKTLKLWDLASGKELCTVTGHADYINAVAITKDAQKVISAAYDNTL